MSAKSSSKLVWTSEAAMVADFVAWVKEHPDRARQTRNADTWTVYPETCGWDLVLRRDQDGLTIGVEAKLSLNATVLCQALSGVGSDYASEPDVRAILVPEVKCVGGLETIARHLGIQVIDAYAPRILDEWERKYTKREPRPTFRPELPWSQRGGWEESRDWMERCPDRPLKLPDYVPDVEAGVPSPLQLTDWKIRAIKVAVVLARRGWVTRADFKALKIDMSRWTQGHWLAPGAARGHWVASERMPNFRAQHPTNFAQIEADLEKWLPQGISVDPAASDLFGAAA